MENLIKMLIGLFLVLQTVNWFALQIYRIKLDRQSEPVTQLQAERVVLHIRLIYFWLLSDYYTSRMQEIYYLLYENPEVNPKTTQKLRRIDETQNGPRLAEIASGEKITGKKARFLFS
ncbi:hypothetical protein [Atopococcus tabaci]|uniref:hypothetical protein n=1 Tax=Atopococcus tabaci TaxID=269774 RepID=UPI0004811003|nr:hypothetical protein [Atopococcus tabaci]